MEDVKTTGRSKLWSLLLYALPVACFLLLCIHQKLLNDFEAGKIESIGVRFTFVIFTSVFIAFRLRGSLSYGRSLFRELSIILIFIGLLYFPLISQLSFIEKSIKETKHAIATEHTSKFDKLVALTRTFPAEYEKYMGKHFKQSKLFVHLDALVKVYVLGVSPNNNVAVGKNGFYFEGWGARKVEKGIVENFDNIADYMGQIPFNEDELRQWKRILEERKYWLRERGSEFVFVLAPTKALVYPEYLPTSLHNAVSGGGTTRYKQLTEYLQKNADINFIDVLPPLLEAKKKRDYPLLFYKTDFHWNFYGAFIAYQAIVDELKTFFPQYGIEYPNFSEFDLVVNEHWAHHRFMNMVGLPESLHKNEHYITMVPKLGGRWDSAGDLPPEGIHDVYPPERQVTADDGSSINLRLILNPEASVPSILLLGDSFFEKCVYFFSGDGKRVLNFRTIVNFPDTIFKYEQPDIVIQEILNMFILRKPPVNPNGFRASYLRGKFVDSGEHVLVAGDAGSFIEYENGLKIDLQEPLVLDKKSVCILRVSGKGLKKGRLKINFMDDKGWVSKPQYCKVKKGLEELYIELPPRTVAGIYLSNDQGKKKLIIPEMFEVRSENAVSSGDSER